MREIEAKARHTVDHAKIRLLGSSRNNLRREKYISALFQPAAESRSKFTRADESTTGAPRPYKAGPHSRRICSHGTAHRGVRTYRQTAHGCCGTADGCRETAGRRRETAH